MMLSWPILWYYSCIQLEGQRKTNFRIFRFRLGIELHVSHLRIGLIWWEQLGSYIGSFVSPPFSRPSEPVERKQYGVPTVA
jgi:hypothetical protein